MTVSQDASTDASAIDWQKIVLEPSSEGVRLIEKLAERRFSSYVLADEAATYVLERLSENNWQICAQFKGNSQPKTYLHTLIVNLLEEFSRKRFGRPRPPAWLKRQGQLWVNLWKELCLERQSLPELVHRYEQSGLYQGAWVRQVGKVIKARIPRCGEFRFNEVSAADIASVSDHAAVNKEAQSELQHACTGDYEFALRAEAELLLVVQAVMDPDPTAQCFSKELAQRLNNESSIYAEKLQSLQHALQLSDQEIVVLRMIYCDGMSQSAVSLALGLSTHSMRVMLGNTLSRIRDAIAECELDLHSLLGKI